RRRRVQLPHRGRRAVADDLRRPRPAGRDAPHRGTHREGIRPTNRSTQVRRLPQRGDDRTRHGEALNVKRLILLVAAVAAFALTGCKAEVSAHPIVIGDSISSGALAQFDQRFNLVAANDPAPRYLATYDSVAGIGVTTDASNTPEDQMRDYWTVH